MERNQTGFKRGRPPKATADDRLKDDMARLGYSSVLPGLDLALQELSNLRQRILDLVGPQHAAMNAIEAIEADAEEVEVEVEEEEMEPAAEAGPELVERSRRGRPPGRGNGPMTVSAKAKLKARTEYRWNVVREAGLTSKYLPSNALVHRAEMILARRAKRAG